MVRLWLRSLAVLVVVGSGSTLGVYIAMRPETHSTYPWDSWARAELIGAGVGVGLCCSALVAGAFALLFGAVVPWLLEGRALDQKDPLRLVGPKEKGSGEVSIVPFAHPRVENEDEDLSG